MQNSTQQQLTETQLKVLKLACQPQGIGALILGNPTMHSLEKRKLVERSRDVSPTDYGVVAVYRATATGRAMLSHASRPRRQRSKRTELEYSLGETQALLAELWLAMADTRGTLSDTLLDRWRAAVEQQ